LFGGHHLPNNTHPSTRTSSKMEHIKLIKSFNHFLHIIHGQQ
jgi:hypothetical protein